MGVTAVPPIIITPPSRSFSLPAVRRGVLGFEEGDELPALSKLVSFRIGDAAALI